MTAVPAYLEIFSATRMCGMIHKRFQLLSGGPTRKNDVSLLVAFDDG
jgi:hypothetical protein